MTPFQETPQIFTLTLLLSVLASFVVFLIAAYRLIRGRRPSALRLLSRWGACAGVYLMISISVSLIRPVRIVEQGQNWCFDDWCLAVEGVRRTPSPNGRDVTFTAEIRIYNDARSPEGVRGFWAYLRDENDRRYLPTPGPWQDIVASRVQGHGFAHTSIDFVVPKDARPRGFVTGHGSGTSCGLLPSLLEIGQGGCLFHRPNMIRIE
jgi:hypothetical protein